MTPDQPEIIIGGTPDIESVITLPMFGRDYPLMHGAAAYVAQDAGGSAVLVAIGHPDLKAGLFLAFSADQARSVAAWLLAASAAVDEGRGVQ